VCSSAERTKHKGEEQLLDMYLSKRDALSFRGELKGEAPVQAYVILRDKQGLWSDVSQSFTKLSPSCLTEFEADDQSSCTGVHEEKPGSLGETKATLTAEIQVPPRGQTIDRDIQPGTSRHYKSKSACNEDVRSQDFLTLKNTSVPILQGELGSVLKRTNQNIAAGGDVHAMYDRYALVPLMHSASVDTQDITSLPKQRKKLTGVVLGDAQFWKGRLDAARDACISMQYWWPQAPPAKSEMESSEALADINVWKETLRKPQCCTKFTPDTHMSDISTRFNTKWQLEIEGRNEENTRPDNNFVFNLWQQLMLGCSTVTFSSHGHCQICLPFVDNCSEQLLADFRPCAETVSDRASPLWLARALSEMAVARFKEYGDAWQWELQGFTLHGPVKRNHKEESYDLGVDACYMTPCGSVHSTYILEAQRPGEVQELMHVYLSRGLEHQHELQSSILGHFRSQDLAAWFVTIASTKLLVGYRTQWPTFKEERRTTSGES